MSENVDYGVILEYGIEYVKEAYSDKNRDEFDVLNLDNVIKTLDESNELIGKYCVINESRFEDFLREFRRSVQAGNNTLFIENWYGGAYADLVTQLTRLYVPKVAIPKNKVEGSEGIKQAFTDKKWRVGDEGKANSWLEGEIEVIYFINPCPKR